jgi:hypothetical protein
MPNNVVKINLIDEGNIELSAYPNALRMDVRDSCNDITINMFTPTEVDELIQALQALRKDLE